MSSVFLADDEVHGRKAVLKILKVRRKEDEELWQRFFQECAILSSIDHEHVVRIYDQGFGDEMAYIAMEHLGGGSLREVIDRGLSRRQALSLLSQAASGLGAIHSRGIVHRDIKPANLMLRTEGVVLTIRVPSASSTPWPHRSGEVLGRRTISPDSRGRGSRPSADLYASADLLRNSYGKGCSPARPFSRSCRSTHRAVPRRPAELGLPSADRRPALRNARRTA